MQISEKEYNVLAQKADEFAEILSELGAESVTILISTSCGGDTRSFSSRRGNYFAQIGLASAWLRDMEYGLVPISEGDDED